MPTKEVMDSTLIMEVIHGSHLYGYATEDSDKDYIAVYGLSVEELFSPFYEARNVHAQRDGIDVHYYAIKNFIKACARGAPNVIEALFVRDEHVMYDTNAAKMMRLDAKMFLSRKALGGFWGMAKAHHKKCQDNYDRKMASHAYRAYEAFHQIETTGLLKPWTYDDDKVLTAIRNGELSAARVMTMLADEQESADRLFKKSWLPKEPDYEAIEILTQKVIKAYWDEYYGE